MLVTPANEGGTIDSAVMRLDETARRLAQADAQSGTARACAASRRPISRRRSWSGSPPPRPGWATIRPRGRATRTSELGPGRRRRPGLRVRLREPARRLVQPHDGGVNHPDLVRRRHQRRIALLSDASNRATGRAGPPWPARGRRARPIRRARGRRAVEPEQRARRDHNILGRWQRDDRAQATWPISSTRIRCSPWTRSRNTTPPATGMRTASSATCASAERDRRRAARPLWTLARDSRWRSRRPPGRSRVFSVRGQRQRRGA